MMLCRQIRIKQMQVMKKKKKIDKAHMKKTANNMMLCRQIRTDQMQVIKRKKINKETDGVQRMDQMQVMKRKKNKQRADGVQANKNGEKKKIIKKWTRSKWSQRGLNPRPSAHKSHALTDGATGQTT